MRKIILASQSPRRKELLSDIVSEFEIIPSNADETVPSSLDIKDIPQYLSLLNRKTQKMHAGCYVCYRADDTRCAQAVLLYAGKENSAFLRKPKSSFLSCQKAKSIAI